MKPQIYSGITGNGKMLAAYSSDGHLHRLYWPHIDISQNINVTWAALLSPALGDRAIRLDDREAWVHSQEYVKDSNVLETLCQDKFSRFVVRQLDFVVPDRDILVRIYQLKNISDSPASANLLYYTSLYLDESRLYNSNFYDHRTDTLFHYRQDIWFGVAGIAAPTSYQSGCEANEALYGNLNGNRVAMSPDGCQIWDLGMIGPGESKSAAVCFAAGHTREEAYDNVLYARDCGWDALLKDTMGFWEQYLKKGLLPETADDEIQKLYKRSVMVSKLLMNRETGGIIAAPEFDESCSCCGGYGFCWVRDAVIIAHAMLKSGYPEYAKGFYRWAVKAQNPSGGWSQRHYTTGQLAPRWGDQIDETGAALWGMCQYYKETWDTAFLEEVWPAVEKGAEFLLADLDVETGLPKLSWDLWEERFGEHAYSCAAVYAGIKGAGQIAKALGHSDTAVKWLESAMSIKKKMLDYFWDENQQRFIRSGWINVHWNVFEERKLAGRQVRGVAGLTGYVAHQVFGDDTGDISLLGLTVPFGVVMPDDPRMKKTSGYLVKTLTNPEVGGIKRYTTDSYMGGNPWVLTTLWLGMFEGAASNWDEAFKHLRWAIDRQTDLGLLPEQVDKHSGQPAWVVPLAWSHAMYLLLVNMMLEAKALSGARGET